MGKREVLGLKLVLLAALLLFGGKRLSEHRSRIIVSIPPAKQHNFPNFGGSAFPNLDFPY